ncbi:hypothetical protein [Megamonas hypermegale]|uniref:hypothetical protein n=1 Tax=Megamonas hypermegale TaxID=158847 RepID=UPI0026EFDFB7|nr:hypothetical protein [Megamonas hypermegale]
MYNNLIVEMLRKGYKAEDIASVLAVLLDCSEKIIEDKLKNTTEFTFQEVLKINSEIFNNEMDIRYLFADERLNKTTYNDNFIHKWRLSEWWV